MGIAHAVSTRATCNKRQVGCVLVVDRRIIATGYNGSLPGQPHCNDVGCELNPAGKCTRTVHAELNALLQCAMHGVASKGAVAYVTAIPCAECCKALIQAGIIRIVCEASRMCTSIEKVMTARDIAGSSGVPLTIREVG